MSSPIEVINSIPIPRVVTLIPLLTYVTGTIGVAVTVLTTGQRTAGGTIENPASAPGALGVNEITTASGTASNRTTYFIAPGMSYPLTPNAGPVSVISTFANHAFMGFGIT
jgi:hypothetical protein